MFSDDYMNTLKENFPTLTEEKIKKNVVVLNLFFSTMIVEEVTESPAYTWLALMSDVGGAFGLILGATFLTLVEFIDFVCISITEYLTVKAHQKKQLRN